MPFAKRASLATLELTGQHSIPSLRDRVIKFLKKELSISWDKALVFISNVKAGEVEVLALYFFEED